MLDPPRNHPDFSLRTTQCLEIRGNLFLTQIQIRREEQDCHRNSFASQTRLPRKIDWLDWGTELQMPNIMAR